MNTLIIDMEQVVEEIKNNLMGTMQLTPGCYLYDSKRRKTGILMLINRTSKPVSYHLVETEQHNNNIPVHTAQRKTWNATEKDLHVSILNFIGQSVNYDTLANCFISKALTSHQDNRAQLSIGSSCRLLTPPFVYPIKRLLPREEIISGVSLASLAGKIYDGDWGPIFTGLVSTNPGRVLMYDDKGTYLGYCDKVYRTGSVLRFLVNGANKETRYMTTDEKYSKVLSL